jgi:hypothetical protein
MRNPTGVNASDVVSIAVVPVAVAATIARVTRRSLDARAKLGFTFLLLNTVLRSRVGYRFGGRVGPNTQTPAPIHPIFESKPEYTYQTRQAWRRGDLGMARLGRPSALVDKQNARSKGLVTGAGSEHKQSRRPYLSVSG